MNDLINKARKAAYDKEKLQKNNELLHKQIQERKITNNIRAKAARLVPLVEKTIKNNLGNDSWYIDLPYKIDEGVAYKIRDLVDKSLYVYYGGELQLYISLKWPEPEYTIGNTD